MAAKFKTCILHIGTEKTGTTTLQTFLSLNRDALLRRGYFVPTTLTPYPTVANHERLTTYALNGRKLHDDLRLAAGVTSEAQVEQHRERVRQLLSAEIDAVNGPHEVLLLSNEHCHSRLTDREEVFRLQRLLLQFAERLSVLVYIRPQHELATSLHDQALRAGYFDIDVLPDFKAVESLWVTKQYFDYADLTARWSAAFSPENVNVRIFSPEELSGGDIVADFLVQIGCVATGLAPAPKQNTSLGSDYQAALNLINRITAKQPIGNELRNKLADRLRQLSKLPSAQPTRGEAIAFYESFNDSNELVRLTCFPQRPQLFSPDFGKFPESRPPAISELEVLVRAILNLVDAE